jgi:hypothetical protein
MAVGVALTAAGCQLIGGIDDRSVGPFADGGATDGGASDAPDASDSGNATDSGAMIDGEVDAQLDGGCGNDAALSYADEVLCDSPLAYWRLNETNSGSMANDATHDGHDATYVGGVTFQAKGIPGNGGDPAVALDGTSGYIDAGSNFAFLGKAPFTLEAWILPTTIDSAFRGVMSNEFQSGTDKEGYVVYLQLDAGIGYDRYEGGTSTPLIAPDSGLTASAGWYHVVGVYDGASTALYVNANLVASSKTSLAIQSTTCIFAMGATHCGEQGYFQGSLDEIAVYAGALSPGRIQKHYQVGSGQ